MRDTVSCMHLVAYSSSAKKKQARHDDMICILEARYIGLYSTWLEGGGGSLSPRSVESCRLIGLDWAVGQHLFLRMIRDGMEWEMDWDLCSYFTGRDG